MSDDTRRATAHRTLDDALRATGPSELAEQIGDGAVARYEERVAAATFEGADTITGWWRTQPPAVLDALLEALAQASPTVVEEVALRTGTTGAELLTELIRDDGEAGARRAYERLVRRLIHRAHQTRGDGQIPGTGALARAVEDLDPDVVPARFGAGEVIRCSERVARARRAEQDAAQSVVLEWRRRRDGERAIEDIVATLEREHPEEFDNATRGTSLDPAAELADVLRDTHAAPLYDQLVRRVAEALRAKALSGR